MMHVNPNLDLVIINVYAEFGQIISSILSQDNEKKLKVWHQSRAITLSQIFEIDAQQSQVPNLDLVNINVYRKFGKFCQFFLKILSKNKF